ncbi:MAG: DUF6796 family protein [Parvularculaceae bacterium]
MTDDINSDRLVRIAGWAGLLGALLVGAAEFALQFNPEGGYESAGYGYFADIAPARFFWGHYAGVLAAPLYIVGYWYLSRMLAPGGKRLAATFFLIGAYAFAVGTAWLGQRAFLGFTVQAMETGGASEELLQTFATLNEPLVNVLRAAMLAVSAIWVVMIVRGGTRFPRWMAIMSPFALLAAIFALYSAAPAAGVFVLPVAMNAAHAVVFALALATERPRR